MKFPIYLLCISSFFLSNELLISCIWASISSFFSLLLLTSPEDLSWIPPFLQNSHHLSLLIINSHLSWEFPWELILSSRLSLKTSNLSPMEHLWVTPSVNFHDSLLSFVICSTLWTHLPEWVFLYSSEAPLCLNSFCILSAFLAGLSLMFENE